MTKLNKSWMLSAAAMAVFGSVTLATVSFADEPVVEAPMIPTFKLITVSPGGELMTSFGHSAVEVDPDGNPQTSNSIVYEFGLPRISNIVQQIENDPRKVMSLIQVIVNEAVPVDAQMQSVQVFRSLQMRSLRAQRRMVQEDALILSDEEAIALKASLENEFPLLPAPEGSTAILRRSRAQKVYRNFDSNCATWVRDRLMEASPELSAAWQAPAAGPLTLENMLVEAIDYAASSRPDGAVVWYAGTPGMMMNIALDAMAIPERMSQGSQFISALDQMNRQLQLPLQQSMLLQLMRTVGVASRDSDAIKPLFAAYVNRIHTQQLSVVKDRIFLPVKLREALISAGKISVAAPVAAESEPTAPAPSL